MTISAFAAAKKICSLSDWSITNLQLQKMLYIAHMIYLGRTNEPLVNETFEAWDYGPVLPLLYDKVKMFGNKPIENIFYNTNLIETGNEVDVLKAAASFLLPKSPYELVSLTHRKGGAWERNYKPGIKNIKIPNTHILDEYRNAQ